MRSCWGDDGKGSVQTSIGAESFATVGRTRQDRPLPLGWAVCFDPSLPNDVLGDRCTRIAISCTSIAVHNPPFCARWGGVHPNECMRPKLKKCPMIVLASTLGNARRTIYRDGGGSSVASCLGDAVWRQPATLPSLTSDLSKMPPGHQAPTVASRVRHRLRHKVVCCLHR